MPVPSTMMALSDTMVLTPRGRVVSTQAFIIGSGPDGDDQIRLVALGHLLQRRGDEARRAVAAVVGADDQLVAECSLKRSSQNTRSFVAKTDNARGAVAGVLECPQLRIDGRHAEPAAVCIWGARTLLR